MSECDEAVGLQSLTCLFDNNEIWFFCSRFKQNLSCFDQKLDLKTARIFMHNVSFLKSCTCHIYFKSFARVLSKTLFFLKGLTLQRGADLLTCNLHDLTQLPSGQRCQFTRFANAHATSGQAWSDFEGKKIKRKVPRGYNPSDTRWSSHRVVHGPHSGHLVAPRKRENAYLNFIIQFRISYISYFLYFIFKDSYIIPGQDTRISEYNLIFRWRNFQKS